MINLRRRREIYKLTDELQSSGVWLARLGDGNGNKEVPGYPDLRYVRPLGSELVMIVNKGPANGEEGTRVWIGPDPYQRHITRILGLDFSANQSASGVEAHAPSHLLDGTDPLWIDQRQIINLLATPDGMIVTVKAGWVIVDGQPVRVEKQTVTLTPPGSGARYDLIRADSAGMLDVQPGTAVADFVDLMKTDIPAVAEGYVALWAVRLYEAQTAIKWTTAAPDLVDLRFAVRGVMTLGLDNLVDVTIASPADDEVLAYDTGTSEFINQTAAEAGVSEVGHEHVEADITDLDHNAQKIKGTPVSTAVAGDDQKALIYDLTTDSYILADVGGVTPTLAMPPSLYITMRNSWR